MESESGLSLVTFFCTSAFFILNIGKIPVIIKKRSMALGLEISLSHECHGVVWQTDIHESNIALKLLLLSYDSQVNLIALSFSILWSMISPLSVKLIAAERLSALNNEAGTLVITPHQSRIQPNRTRRIGSCTWKCQALSHRSGSQSPSFVLAIHFTT